jgi:hypothetical protein
MSYLFVPHLLFYGALERREKEGRKEGRLMVRIANGRILAIIDRR